MLSGDFFDKLEFVASNIRRRALNPLQKPFGGIQLILSGDFYQVLTLFFRQSLASL
jgi:hypothetical protein